MKRVISGGMSIKNVHNFHVYLGNATFASPSKIRNKYSKRASGTCVDFKKRVCSYCVVL